MLKILKAVFAHAPLFLLAGVLTACEFGTEAEVRESASDFPLRANWSATAAPVAPARVSGNVVIKEFLGSRLNATATVAGGNPNTAYQWRIVRGDCSVNTAAPNNTSPTGVLVFATQQSYPDITTNSAGSGSVTRDIAGALDSLTAYSLRVRVASGNTWNGTNPLACGNLQRS